jgi:hypothetical protein
MTRIKRCNDELKANRPTVKEVKFIPRLPIYILVENVRSVYNVGSIFHQDINGEPWNKLNFLNCGSVRLQLIIAALDPCHLY